MVASQHSLSGAARATAADSVSLRSGHAHDHRSEEEFDRANRGFHPRGAEDLFDELRKQEWRYDSVLRALLFLETHAYPGG